MSDEKNVPEGKTTSTEGPTENPESAEINQEDLEKISGGFVADGSVHF